jgi:type VI protein secretion system component Hcp
MRQRRVHPERGGDELEHEQPQAVPPVAERLLALQRSAGNRAVGAVLARAPDTKEKPKAPAATGYAATLPGIGTIELQSLSFGSDRTSPGGGGGGDRDQSPREMTFSSKVGEHSTKLQQALGDGRAMDVVVTMPGGVKLTLKGAIVSSYSAGAGGGGDTLETWTLNFVGIEQEKQEGPSEKGGAPSWDLGDARGA